MPNVFADKAGTTCPERLFVVGAHYDSVAAGPGADDNASGVAGMLEIARVLHGTGLPISVRFAGFALEENGLVGSSVMAQALRARDAQVVGMVSLEMIGFTKPGTDQFIGTENDYLAMVGDPASQYLARVFGAASFTYNNFFFGVAAVIDPSVLPDIRRSDHATFWDQGYRALLLTDTANFRNPNYHTANDTIDTLDFNFMANSVRTTLAGLVAFATVDANDNNTPDACE
jgi:Zn-dependent M28 family amino/carboxypeptidase